VRRRWPAPGLIGRDFTAEQPGQRLVGGITYLKTGEGWLYLATVIDLATRMVTGWQLASHMRTSLVTDALAMAISHGHAAPGAVFHSDKGRNIPRRSSPGSARRTACAPAPGGPGCAGTTPPPKASSPP
jgi:transposase InsO family protein